MVQMANAMSASAHIAGVTSAEALVDDPAGDLNDNVHVDRVPLVAAVQGVRTFAFD
jgi:hypothetical protein